MIPSHWTHNTVTHLVSNRVQEVNFVSNSSCWRWFWQYFAATMDSMFGLKSCKLASLSTNCKCSSVSLECNTYLFSFIVEKTIMCKDEENNLGNLSLEGTVKIRNPNLCIFLLQYGIALNLHCLKFLRNSIAVHG